MKLKFLPFVIFVFSSVPFMSGAAPLYWDMNGTTDGAGNPGGTWVWSTSDPYWNTASDGGASGSLGGWVNGSAVIFSAGTDAIANFTVAPNATVNSVDSITYNNGGASVLVTISPGATITNVTGNIDVNGTSNTRFAFNSVLTGSHGLTKGGAGILEFNSNIPTYTGNTFVTAGTLRIVTTGRLPSATEVDISSGANLDVRGNITISGISGAGQVYEGQSNNAATLTLKSNGSDQTFTGVVAKPTASGTLHLTKDGSYTQTLGGTADNLYIGNTIVNDGTLALAKTEGKKAIPGGSVTINSGATLRLDAANQIADAAALQLAGGAFDLNGTSGESFTTALSLSGSSTLNFGGGLNTLSFGDSHAQNWDGSTLTITNFTAGVDLLRFGTSGSGLTADQLALFRFADYGNAPARIDESGYIAPVPEPSTGLLLVGVALPLLELISRRKAGRAAVRSSKDV